MLEVNGQSMKEEISGLRRLATGLVTRQREACSSKQAIQLANAHMRAVSRVVELIEADQKLVQSKKADTWTDDFLAALDRVAISMGEQPVSEQVRLQVLRAEQTTDSQLANEIASVRDMLKNVIDLDDQTQDAAEYMRMVEIYGSGCQRLARMLKVQGGARSPLEQYLRKSIDQAIKEWINERG